MSEFDPGFDPADFRPGSLDSRVMALLADYPAELFNEQLHHSIELLERYSLDLAVGILNRLEIPPQLDTWRAPAELIRRLRFAPQFGTALSWLLERLVETGRIEIEARGAERHFRLRRGLWQPEIERLRALGLAIDPTNAATLDLMDRAADLYPAVARGELSGEQALFGAGEIGLWLAYFDNGNPAYAINNWLAAYAVADRLAEKSDLRILEVGAGAGSGAEILLRVLTERSLVERLDGYSITEPHPFFRRRAERRLKSRYKLLPLAFAGLDINRTWREQGITDKAYDLVFGVNVFHVADDLSYSLGQARERLAPDGWLVLGECLRPRLHQPIYTELMFQILNSYTEVKTDPDTRPNPGFLTAAQWRRALAQAGFAEVEIIPDVERIEEIYPHFFTGVICGR